MCPFKGLAVELFKLEGMGADAIRGTSPKGQGPEPKDLEGVPGSSRRLPGGGVRKARKVPSRAFL